ncbi:heat-inducible transcriptional repressor HrcA, partial [Mycoplasmoides pneumoniae]
EYIAYPVPVGSKLLTKKYFKNLSGGTLRNEMAVLEKEGYLKKNHISSGRIPSQLGYQYYVKLLTKNDDKSNLKTRLRAIILQKHKTIDEIIELGVKFINEMVNLPVVLTHFSSDEVLKKIDLIMLDQSCALLLLVSASGNVFKKTISYANQRQFEDIMVCVRIFNDRIIDTRFCDIAQHLDVLKEIIRSKVHEYQYVIDEILFKLFNFEEFQQARKQVYGIHYLAQQPEFANQERLTRILNLLEDTSVWQQMAFMNQNNQTTNITFGDKLGLEGEEVSVASTLINTTNESKHQLAIVGPTRMDYQKVKALLLTLKEEIEEYDKQLHGGKTTSST